MKLARDYAEKVYAGVLGKIIGVYAGRPFEGWTYGDIMSRLGEIDFYVNDKVAAFNKTILGSDYAPPLIVTDDDITGTFTFLRALPDYGNRKDISAEQIGRTWLNYIVEGHSVFWWGGRGNSTEHTAYLRLKEGIRAPASGSAALNGLVVAEQIGSQIFIDGWAMVAPGDPAYAAELARKAASVSHDGEAIYGAQVIAAMEAAAFVETDMDKLLDIGVSYIPKDSIIRRVVSDVREWHSVNPDWHATMARIQGKYGYDKFPGNVHIIPNHAVVIMGLLYGKDDFRTAMRVTNTAGWDTDCNAGNVGCLLGIRNGLSIFEGGPDWRTPVADRILMPAADGGRAITDAVTESMHIVNIGRAIAGEPPLAPKNGARFNFDFPGALQGFSGGESGTTVLNTTGFDEKSRCLAMRFSGTGSMSTPTFMLPGELEMAGYQFLASPTLYPGQLVRARVKADRNMAAVIFITVYNAKGTTDRVYGKASRLEAGEIRELSFTVPETNGNPVAQVGVEARAENDSSMQLDFLSWDGAPNVVFHRPDPEGILPAKNRNIWRRAWIQGVDQWDGHWKEAFRLAQNTGRGLLIQGTREWTDYEAEATVRISMAEAGGIAVRVQGMRRYYALLLCKDRIRLVKALDGETVLAEQPFGWELEKPCKLRLRVDGTRIRAWANGELLFETTDAETPLVGGAAAFVLEEGHMMSDEFAVRP